MHCSFLQYSKNGINTIWVPTVQKNLVKQQGKKCKRKIQDQQTGTIASFIYT